MNQVSELLMHDKELPMKRETGEISVRTRHRNQGAQPIYHRETGKMAKALNYESGGLPDLKYASVSLMPRVIGCTS